MQPHAYLQEHLSGLLLCESALVAHHIIYRHARCSSNQQTAAT
jgi:hypothetical protein